MSETKVVKFVAIDEIVQAPERATIGSAGFDLRAYLYDEECDERVEKLYIGPGCTTKISTGLKFELPKNHVMIIHPRSSKGIKNGLVLQNTTGVLDADYRGICYLFVKNTSDEVMQIEQGERICQAIILEYPEVIFEEVNELTETQRAEGGFGSTGIK